MIRYGRNVQFKDNKNPIEIVSLDKNLCNKKFKPNLFIISINEQ